MPDIKVFPQDKPISVVAGGPDASMPYGVVNVHGMRIAQFATEEEARACADEANKSEESSEPETPEPEIESEPEPEPDTEAIDTPQQKHDTKSPRAARKKAVTKKRGYTMPRVAKKKKATVKKRAKSATKKVVQKVMKRRKKRKTA